MHGFNMRLIKVMKMVEPNTSKPAWINPQNVQYFEEISFGGKIRTDVRFYNDRFVIEESTEWLALQIGQIPT